MATVLEFSNLTKSCRAVDKYFLRMISIISTDFHGLETCQVASGYEIVPTVVKISFKFSCSLTRPDNQLLDDDTEREHDFQLSIIFEVRRMDYY